MGRGEKYRAAILFGMHNSSSVNLTSKMETNRIDRVHRMTGTLITRNTNNRDKVENKVGWVIVDLKLNMSQ